MNKKLIAFTLENAPSSDYDKVQKKIAQVTQAWAQIDETLYLAITERSSVNLREIIKDINFEGDLEMVFVSQWDHPSAWWGLADDVSNWIKNN